LVKSTLWPKLAAPALRTCSLPSFPPFYANFIKEPLAGENDKELQRKTLHSSQKIGPSLSIKMPVFLRETSCHMALICLSPHSFQKWDTSYSDLLYDPDWKRKRGSGATASSQDLEDFSDDSLSGYCTSPDKATLKTLQNSAGSADNQSAGSTNTTTTRQNKPPADPVYRTRDVNSVTGSKRKKKGSTQSQNSQKDILEKNKHTLGVRGPRTHSYLQLHQKNADKDTSGQVWDAILSPMGYFWVRLGLAQ
uniref:Uncharacterized protein n=1 Tax=Leptobrachium leishanense TaxID=445787 RepID=A0A8C5QD42_9ANUR